MTDLEERLTLMEKRVCSAERASRSWRAITLGALALFTLLILSNIGEAGDDPHTLRAPFQVVDKSGRKIM
ncbi:MAG: hypothetical protein KY468_19985, partial [Armatimonadetes bacterium]|nr:hypothetical protein [Armatimonadota bacterium]